MSWKLNEEEAPALRFSPLRDTSALEQSASCELAVFRSVIYVFF